jgi:hypothetical protein
MADLQVKELELFGRQKPHYLISGSAIYTIHGIIEFTADASSHHLPKFGVDLDCARGEDNPLEPLLFEDGLELFGGRLNRGEVLMAPWFGWSRCQVL